MTYPNPNDPYGATPGAYPPPQFQPYAPRRQNGLALASMIVSIVSFVMCFGVPGIVGAIMGHKARKQLRERNEDGEGFATAGIIVGWIGFGIGIAVVLFYLIIFLVILGNHGFDSTTTSTTNYN